MKINPSYCFVIAGLSDGHIGLGHHVPMIQTRHFWTSDLNIQNPPGLDMEPDGSFVIGQPISESRMDYCYERCFGFDLGKING